MQGVAKVALVIERRVLGKRMQIDHLTARDRVRRIGRICMFIAEYERGRRHQRGYDALAIINGTSDILQALSKPSHLAR